MMFLFDDGNDSKRTLGVRDRQILYKNAKGKCENPACGKKIDYDEMQVGHKTAWSRGGSTTLKNSVCLCYRCNKLQGTDTWTTFMKKQNIIDPKTKLKESLKTLTLAQLKILATKHKIKVTGRVVSDFFDSHRQPPTKIQYINKLSSVVTAKEIQSIPKDKVKKPVKRRSARKSDDFWSW